MDFFHFANPERIHFIWLVLAVTLICGFILMKRAGRMDAFMSREMQARLLTTVSGWRKALQLLCLAICGILCIFALMRPQAVSRENVPVSKTSANVYVVLDVSKSMLATDVAPSRLDRAKSEIRDMLPSFAAHRVGLLAFAGQTQVMSPLTTDHGFFRLALDSANPSSIRTGGTKIGDAIQKATKLLSRQEGPKAILLITDGEDHDSFPIDAAKNAKKEGVVIVTVGFGSESGTTIDVLDPATGQKKRILDQAGNAVISKLDGETLRKIALETNGAYVPASSRSLDLDNILKRLILPLVEVSDDPNTREIKVELFQWFLFAALFFLASSMLLEGGWRKNSHAMKGLES